MAVLVDSSVWIAASSSKNPECLLLKRMIQNNELICIIRPIQVEVCQGVRSEAEFHKVWEAFLGFNTLEVTDRIWGLSAWNYFKCRKKGISLSTIDCLIATVATEYRVQLWSIDRVFGRIQALLGLDLKS